MRESSKKLYIYIYIRAILIILFSVLLLSLLSTKSEATTSYDSLTFNAEYYLSEYPDVRNAVGSTNYWGAYNHFVNFGINEGRKGSPYFDVHYYLNSYSDLQRAFGTNYREAYNHFVNTGINENRSGSPYIDPEYYASKYPDVKRAFGKDYKGIYNHFYTNGLKEGRRGSKYFDVEYYLNTNADLIKAFGKGNYLAAFNHFLTCGINELRDPSSDVNLDCYLASYKDLQNAFGNNKNYRGLFEHCYTNSEIDQRATRHKVVDITTKTEPTCTERGQVGGTQCERCGKIILSPTYKPALGHDWKEPEFKWEGTDKCTVKFTCKRANHPQTLDATITSEEKDGKIVYTATVTLDGETYTNTKNGSSVPNPGGTTPGGGGTGGGGGGGSYTPPHTHTWGNLEITWSGTTATATVKCSGCGNTQNVNVNVTNQVITVPTCTESGKTTYTATCEYNGETYTSTHDVITDATGHNFDNAKWKYDDSSKKLERQCQNKNDGIQCTEKELMVEKETKISVTRPESTPELTAWGYDHDNSGDYTLSKEGKLSGEVSEQKLKDNVYGNDKATGFYFAIVIDPTISEKISELDESVKFIPTIKVKHGEVSKTLTLTNENDKQTLLVRVGNATNTACLDGCTCATGGSIADCQCANRKVEITVDLDGDYEAYKEVTYTLDYCGVKFEKQSNVEVDSFESKISAESGEFNGWKPGEGYSVTVKKDENDPYLIKVGGFITVFDDTNWENKNNPFGSQAHEHYLAFRLKKPAEVKANLLQSSSSTVVKFLTDGEGYGETNKVSLEGFSGTDEIYVLKYVNPMKANSGREFKIEVDFDGEGDTYAPTTITIDWSELDFQYNSKFTDTKVANSNDSEISKEDKETLKGWGYYLENAGKNLDIQYNSQIGKEILTGSVKQQNVSGAGFQNPNGYYVVLKVYGPTENQVNGAPHYQKDKWTVKFYDESGNLKNSVFPDDGENFVVALIKLKDDGETKEIKYEIDWDGDGDYFLPFEETIDYSSLQFLSAHTITFDDKDKNTDNETITVWDGETITPPTSFTPEADDPYHGFAYWNKEDGTKYDAISFANKNDSDKDGKETGDVTLVPHWNLYSDKFISDVIEDLNKTAGSVSSDFYDKFKLEKDEGNIKIKIINPETTLDAMNTTSIPGAIAYVLVKDDIKEITLSIDENHSVTFDKSGTKSIANETESQEIQALKKKVQDGVKSLYDNTLGSNQDKTTLSALAAGKYPSFTIKLGNTSNTVTLANEDGTTENVKKEYKFTFESTVAVVSNERELKDALNNSKITDILVKTGFELEDENTDERKSHTLVIKAEGREIKIASLDSSIPQTISDKEQTEEGEDDKRPVIEVKSGEITFENLKIEGATRAISVDKGATVVAKNVTAIDSQDTAFDVAEGATFTGTDLKYLKTNGESKESYHYPTICGKGSVTVTDVQNIAKVENYQRISHLTGQKYTEADFRDPETGKFYAEYSKDGKGEELNEDAKKLLEGNSTKSWDELKTTGHTHYYLDPGNSKYYWVYMRDGAITSRYFVKGEEIAITPENYKTTGFYKNVIELKDGSTYVHDGWSKQDYYYLDTSGRVYNFNTTKVTDPTTLSEKTMLYPRYVEGYSVSIDVDTGEEKTVTMKFGVIKSGGTKTIGDLINEISEFKAEFKKLQDKATEGMKILDENDKSTEVTVDTKIDKNIKLVVGTIQTASNTTFEGPSIDGLETKGTTISGVISTVSETDGKYYIPVKLASENFQDKVSTVSVTGPNDVEPRVYTYSEDTENGIATASLEPKEMTINLEAIKQNKITTGSGKNYKISIDVDGPDADNFAVKNYTIDYSDVETLEEVINNAAKNTANANNLKYEKDNYIKGNTDKYTLEYDRANKIKHTMYNKNGNECEEYVFPKANYIEGSNAETVIVASKGEAKDKSRVYLNDWRYDSSLRTGYGINELSLLQDLIQKDKATINAIDRIKKVEDEENTYEITINVERMKSWLNLQYISSESQDLNGELKEESVVKLIVTLIDDNQHIGEIKTSSDFTITDTVKNLTYNNNKLDVKISEVGTAKIKSPEEMLGKNDVNATKQEIIEFIENGIKWWEDYTGSEHVK